MSFSFFDTERHILSGQSIARILMNRALSHERIRGVVVDVGGGRHPDYYDYLKREGEIEMSVVDQSVSGIDLETDPLPQPSQSVDTVVLCNVLEHIYHHAELLREILRVLRSHGKLVGFVPFWVGYHPDPHDYFRYTNESLQLLLSEAGFESVQIRTVGGGPFLANYNTLMLSVPRVVRCLLYPLYAGLDRVFLLLRPGGTRRFPLGFVFTAIRP